MKQRRPLVLVRVLLLWTNTMTKATLTKDNISLGLAYRFRGLVHYHQGGNMAASRQAWARQAWARQGWELYIFTWRLLGNWLPGS